MSPFCSEKHTEFSEENSQYNSKVYSPWNTEEESSDSLLGNFAHIFSEVRYDVSCIRLAPQKAVLTSELPMSFTLIVFHPKVTKKLRLR
ncbi:hypothetical protein NPIL_338141 [Nephila pilipes]|uniref:Uncharacterized protein n=1 Tax=Nephila pilipes TaxID=299642 RepID=A0A8X6PVJ0_NEPPI|nr:hypothetical protein NPIL_338141 [Nephila pilipes]